jgi:predicted small lipoprotein YifL
MRTLPRYALAVPALAVLALAACGQKGPLVLPSKAPATKVLSTSPPAAADATAAPAPAAAAAKPGAKDGEDDASPPKR